MKSKKLFTFSLGSMVVGVFAASFTDLVLLKDPTIDRMWQWPIWAWGAFFTIIAIVGLLAHWGKLILERRTKAKRQTTSV